MPKIDSSLGILAQPVMANLHTLSAVLRVQYGQRDDGEFNHSSLIILLDAERRVLAQTGNLGDKPVAGSIAA